MLEVPGSKQMARVFYGTIVGLVRRDGPDLSARQLGVFLACYLLSEKQTVRGLAAYLHISKPAVTRAIDRLEASDLARRKTDPMDRRSILLQRTIRGSKFLREIQDILTASAKTASLGYTIKV